MESLSKYISYSIFERFFTEFQNLKLINFHNISFNERFRFMFEKLHQNTNLSLLETKTLLSTFYYFEELLNVIVENENLKPILMVYRLSPIIELLQTFLNNHFNFSSNDDIFQNFCDSIIQSVTRSSSSDWPEIMTNIEKLTSLNHFQTNDSDSLKKLLEFGEFWCLY